MIFDNKLGLKNDAELARAEERISKTKALELYDSGRLTSLGAGTFAALSFIHRFLFDEIYAFAGEIRTVNSAKGSFRFAAALYLDQALARIETMPQSTFDEIVEKYVEMNVAHPFREGNGRSGRIWLDLMLKKELGLVIDWRKVDREDYLLAMERSPIRDIEIKQVLKVVLTDRIDDREIYMMGIDQSYAYEGYAAFKAADFTQDKE